MGTSSATAAPARHVPPKGKGKVVIYSGRAVGGATNAITLQAGESSSGVSIAYAGATGQYTVTLPGKGGCQLGACHATFEGADEKGAKVESRSESARTVTFSITDFANLGADVTLAASEYLNFYIEVVDV